MSETTRINRIADEAYTRLDALNDITMTAYRNVCFRMALEEECGHRLSAPAGWRRPKGASAQAAARMFVVKRIAEALTATDDRKLTIKDVLRTQPSAVYAASIVANYRDEVMRAWDGLDVAELADLDYCKLVGSA
jgi:hypothetical protein